MAFRRFNLRLVELNCIETPRLFSGINSATIIMMLFSVQSKNDRAEPQSWPADPSVSNILNFVIEHIYILSIYLYFTNEDFFVFRYRLRPPRKSCCVWSAANASTASRNL